MDLNKISKDLQELLLDGRGFCTTTLQKCISDALGYLLDPKLKRTSVQAIAKCLHFFPNESKLLLIKTLEDFAKEQPEDEYLTTILALCDAPSQIKEIILEYPQFLCSYLLKSLQDLLPSFSADKLLQCDSSYSNTEEELFVAIKVAVHILQKIGAKLLDVALNDSSLSTWQSAWVKSLIPMLLSAVCCEVLQKETRSITGIALAHIVNSISAVGLSRDLVVYLLQMTAPTTSNQRDSKLHLGPVIIHYICKGVNRTSALSQIAIVNGVLTVCSPEILLEDIVFSQNGVPQNKSLLKHSLDIVFESCSTIVIPKVKYYSFQVLSGWLDMISRVTIEKYHSKNGSERLFHSESFVCNNLLDLVWDNREDVIEGIPKLVVGIFGKLLELHNMEKTICGKFTNDKLMEFVTERLLKDPWYIRGKYSLLCELLRHINSSQILGIDADFPSTLCKCYGASNLASTANECYKSFITAKKFRTTIDKIHMILVYFIRHIQEWSAEKWRLLFADEFLTMLVSKNTRSTENCVLYFVPTTLQQMPMVFNAMKDVIYAELNKEYSCEEYFVDEWQRRRKTLCYGYCAVLRMGRKLGFASIQDVDLSLLQECLKHSDDNLRAEAVSVLCYNNKTTEPISPDEQSLILGFLLLNFNCASSSFRQTLFMSMKNLMARFRDSCITMLRDFIKVQKRKQKAETISIPDDLASSIDFVERIVSLSLRCLFSGASFQRKKTGLQLLYTVLETFSSPSDAVKKGRTAESLKNLMDWVQSIEKWRFINLRNLAVLITCMQDQHDEIRELALDISKWFPFHAMDMSANDIKEFGRDLMTQAVELWNSPRIRDTESGAVLFEFFCQRFLTWDANSIFDIKSLKNEGCDAFPGSLSFDGIVHVMFLLLQNAETQIKRSYSDVLDAAMKRPVFGLTMATHRCFGKFLQHLSSYGKSYKGVQQYSEVFRRLIDNSVKVCRAATDIALSVFANDEKTLSGSPSFADMKEALENTIKNCQCFNSLEKSIGFQHCLELVSSFYWLNIKATTLFLGEIGNILTLNCLKVTEKDEIFPHDFLAEIGMIFRETLINCRHKGVIENSCVGFQKLCRAVSTISSKTKLLEEWLMETIDAVARNDLNSSVTKRSAGLPMFIQPIISACIKNPKFSFQTYIENLITVAKRPISPSIKEQSDLPQVQAMNILKAMYRDSSTGAEILRFAGDGLILSIEGFMSDSWSVRNAAQILLGAVVPRMLGQRITQADKSHHNSMTASSFFKMYPKLSDFFVKILQHGSICERNLTRLPGLIPVLTILSKLRPCKETKIQSRLYPLLQNLLSCPVFTVRKLAASSLAVFMPANIAIAFIEKWTKEPGHPDHNFNHGFLLFVKQLLENKSDYARFLKESDIDVVLDVSTTVLHTENQPFVYCTLLEIYQILIPLLYKSNDKKNLICRECVRDGLMELMRKVNTADFSGNGVILGASLVPKRIAQASLSYIVREQFVEVDFTNRLLVSLLTSSNDLLVSEAAVAITQFMLDGALLKQSLRKVVFDSTCGRMKLWDSQTANLALMECCIYSFSSDNFQNFDVTSQRISEFLHDFKTLCLEDITHRQLAVVLPFAGLMFNCCFRNNSNIVVCDEGTLELVFRWSERVYACSFAGRREVLRRSSLKAIHLSAGTIFHCYEDTTKCVESLRRDKMANICSRLIMALLNLVQDEDESIRNAACDAVASVISFPNREITCKINSNLAMLSLFAFIASRMIQNQTLLISLCQQLKELLETQVHSFSESRTALLFEQESANLFAEDIIFAEQIIQCLQDVFNASVLQEIKMQRNLHHIAFPTDDGVDDMANELTSKCSEVVSTSLASTTNLYRGMQTLMMAVNLALRFSLFAGDISKDKDTDVIVNFLSKAKSRKDIHPALEEDISKTLTDFQSRISL